MSNLMKNIMKKNAGDEKPINPYANSDDGDSCYSEEEEEVGELGEDHNYGIKPIAPTQKIDFSGVPKPPKGNTQISESKENEEVSWNVYFERDFMANGTPVYLSGDEGPIFLCCHGAGHSALSFAMLSMEVKKFARLASFDFRGHGASQVTDDFENLSIEHLVTDCLGKYYFLIFKQACLDFWPRNALKQLLFYSDTRWVGLWPRALAMKLNRWKNSGLRLSA
jgi:protein phosphatase methylesterase 1